MRQGGIHWAFEPLGPRRHQYLWELYESLNAQRALQCRVLALRQKNKTILKQRSPAQGPRCVRCPHQRKIHVLSGRCIKGRWDDLYPALRRFICNPRYKLGQYENLSKVTRGDHKVALGLCRIEADRHQH